MTTTDSFSNSNLLPELEYLLESDIKIMKPWQFVTGERRVLSNEGFKKRFPESRVYVFAVKTDCDDVACLDLESRKSIYIVHDYSNTGWETKEHFSSFWDWFRRAVEDMIDFAIADIEYEKRNPKH